MESFAILMILNWTLKMIKIINLMFCVKIQVKNYVCKEKLNKPFYEYMSQNMKNIQSNLNEQSTRINYLYDYQGDLKNNALKEVFMYCCCC